MGAVLLREHLVEAVRRGSGVAAFGHTFSGNPLGAATCLAVLDYLQDHHVLTTSVTAAPQLEAGLRALAARFPFIADVRGRGLLWGFRARGRPGHAPGARTRRQNVAGAFVDECFDRGLIVYPAGIAPFNNAAIIAPPLTIDAAEVVLLLSTFGAELGSSWQAAAPR